MKTIIAICGPSASGKDTLADTLYTYLKSDPLNPKTGMIISDTTRPKRPQEIEGVHYNYLSLYDFLINAQNNQYLEFQKFRGWYYGTPINEIIDNDISIGIFNAGGLYQLMKWHGIKYNVIPIYLKAGFFTRLKRSIEREGKFKFEFIRRGITDLDDFVDIKSRIKHKYYCDVLEFKTDTGTKDIYRVIAYRIINILKRRSTL